MRKSLKMDVFYDQIYSVILRFISNSTFCMWKFKSESESENELETVEPIVLLQ